MLHNTTINTPARYATIINTPTTYNIHTTHDGACILALRGVGIHEGEMVSK